jgi:uncharacterized Ntn-hydrolase superfamily protein
MANNKAILGFAAVAAVAAILLTHKGAVAAQEYICPYCGEEFLTLLALQQHVVAQHPGERIPISIQWS